ncbi:Thiamin pyrophosphokinase [Leucosporidium creatinivorum]|uniref:Thiamine pyrophosphokinase n=1 Tax=Leucosporidium creatinivorum TaxID=106004 RepID=A0A1Y2ECI2_9BASI|nr:Thiamin pyrophosphokinase [Leucosporidium creatinivorum]
MASKQWTTISFMERSETYPNALIILNTPLAHDQLFRQIWAAASVRYCADGGANRLYDRFEDEATFLPDLIKGDLDSLKPHVRAYYESKNVPVIHDPDQDSTDLGKCIAALVEEEKRLGQGKGKEKEHQLVISGGLSGRLDQTIHTMHALMQLSEVRERTWAVGSESIACVLGKGNHDLTISLQHFGGTCGILPVGERAFVKTKGLKWDLGPDAYPTSVAEGVSSSNHLPQEDISVETDVPIVWTVEVRGAE